MTRDPASQDGRPDRGPAARRARRWAPLFLLALVALPYLPGLGHGFVYDDYGQIVENPYLDDPAHVWDVLSGRTLGDTEVLNGRRPVMLLSCFLDRALWGERAFGYHLTNLLLFLAGIGLLYGWVVRLRALQQPNGPVAPFALTAALLAGLHPAMTEAVQVPSFRPDLLVLVFALLGLHGALWGARSRGPGLRAGWGIATAGCFLLALGSKESGAVFLPLLTAHWAWFRESRPRLRDGAWLAAGLSAVLAMVATGWAGGESFQAATGTWNGQSYRPPENLWSVPWVWAVTLRTLLAPWPLIVDRVVPPVAGLFDPRFWVGAGLVAVAGGALAACILRRWRWPGLGLTWIALFFAPVSNLVPLFNPVADRYLTAMIPGGALAAAWILAGPGFTGRRARLRMVSTGILCTLFGVLTLVRGMEYRDDATLWARTLAQEPRSARAHVYMGLEARADGRLSAALGHFERAITLNPQLASAWVNRGQVRGMQNDLAGAERDFLRALELDPGRVSACWNVSVLYRIRGEVEKADDFLEKTLASAPDHVQARRARILRLVEQARYEQALEEVLEMLETQPDRPDLLSAREFLQERLGLEQGRE